MKMISYKKNSGFFLHPCLNPYETAVKVRAKAVVNVLVGVVFLLMTVGFCSASVAGVDFNKKIHSVNIPAMNAADALSALAFQTDTVLLFPYQDAKAQQANAVVGDYTLKQAITILLKGSGLVSSLTDDGAIKISTFGSLRLKKNDRGSEMNTKRKILASTIAFFMGAGGVAQAVAEESEDIEWALEEIVVTATKREVGLQDAPIAVSALSSELIEKRNLVGMSDYLSTLPGVSMQDRGAGVNSVVIRGISSNPQDGESAAGVYFGETSLTELRTGSLGGTAGNGDVKLVDIERIEVLRGPQGTLYGVGSMSGTVRVIPASPNLEVVEGRLAARYSQTGEEGGDNTMKASLIYP